MGVSVENLVLLVLAGIALGLLPGTFAQRRGYRRIGDIGAAVALTVTVGWMIVGGRDLVPRRQARLPHAPSTQSPQASLDQSKAAQTSREQDRQQGARTQIASPQNEREQGPNYEPVVLPLRPLRALFKPVVYRSSEEVCGALARAAQTNDLPVHFLIRLLYQESNFRPEAISTAGALGIAQFMPDTASDRRLDNPFDPAQAIPASARLLRDLYRKFGNLGLAAAAYNAGPKRVTDWQTSKGVLPVETTDYVRIVTGFPVGTWTDTLSGSPALRIPSAAPCQDLAGLLAADGPDVIPLPTPDPRIQMAIEAKALAARMAKEAADAKAREAKAAKEARTAQTVSTRKKIPDAERRSESKKPAAETVASGASDDPARERAHSQR